MEKRKAMQPMPSIMQGEIARLNSKYNIKLDKTNGDSENFRIVCFLGKPFAYLHCKSPCFFVRLYTNQSNFSIRGNLAC